MKLTRKFNPANPQQVREFEDLVKRETRVKVGPLDKTPKAIAHVASTQPGREYLARMVGSKAYRLGRSFERAHSKEIKALAHELSHVMQQRWPYNY